jgi:two-component system, OmpR family, KDP operon response regulator KdpE
VSAPLTYPRPSKVYDILVVDDEAALRNVIRASLAASGFAVEEACNGSEAIGCIQQRPFDLVLLDIELPGLIDVETCRQIHAFAPRAGIVMIAMSDAEEDIARGLEAGADDYVTKPFSLRELIGRLDAVLRRTHAIRRSDCRWLQAGDLRLDLDRRLIWKKGELVRLSPKEFDLLALLMKNQGAPVPHTKLLREVWGAEYGGQLEYLRTYVRMLRKKIEDAPARPQYILTEPWVGYRFQDTLALD